MAIFLTILTSFVSLLLILIILLQRGRGGGLTGALGGMGGQSAFGTKAGDVFTRITVVLAIIWVVLNGLSIFAYRSVADAYFAGRSDPAVPTLEASETGTPPAGEAGSGATGTPSEGTAPGPGTAESQPEAGTATPAEGTAPPAEGGATSATPAGDQPANGSEKPAESAAPVGAEEKGPAESPPVGGDAEKK